MQLKDAQLSNVLASQFANDVWLTAGLKQAGLLFIVNEQRKYVVLEWNLNLCWVVISGQRNILKMEWYEFPKGKF